MSKESKKIAVVYSGGAGWGGIETYLNLLFKYFPKDEMELTLFSLGEWPLTDSLRKTGARIELFSGNRIGITTVYKMSNMLKQEGYCLVVSHGNVSTAYGRAASLLSGVPSLVTVHSDIDYDYPNPLFRLIYKTIDVLTRFQTTRYLAVSQYIAEKIQKSGIKKNKVDVVYNAIELPQDNLVNKRSDGAVVISTVGRLHQVKGFHNLIRAMKLLDDKVTLRIGGEGEEKENLECIIAQEGLQKRVQLVGHVEPFEFIAKSDIFVQPSLVEGFGLATIEAMAVGVPVVVTPVGSLREIVEDGVTGIVAGGQTPPALAAAINTLIESPALRQKLAVSGQDYVGNNFTIEKWVLGTANTYRKAIR